MGKFNSLINRTPSWKSNYASISKGQNAVEWVDSIQFAAERKYGRGTLRLLAPPDLRAKFDRQCALWCTSMESGSSDDVIRESQRMANAWAALTANAEARGADVDINQLQVTTSDGTLVTIVRDDADRRAASVGRRECWSLAEIAALLDGVPAPVRALKRSFAAGVECWWPGQGVPAPPRAESTFDEAVGDPLPDVL
jgi:hypothetical protein